MAYIAKREDRPLPWYVYWRDPATRKQLAKAFPTKKEADSFRDRVSTDLRQGTYVDVRPIPFSEWANGWLERKRPTVSPNAHGVHRWAVEGHLVPAFGGMPIQNLRADQIEQWQAGLLGQGDLSPRSVQMIRQVLANILKDARKKGYLAANPMEAVDSVSVPKRELHFLSIEQIADLCKAAGPMYGTLFALQALCGLRAGEALALQWQDVNLKAGYLTVRRQVVWLRAKDISEGETTWRFVEPKSEAGKRMVEIPPALVRGLEQYRTWRNGNASPDALLFSTREGTPLSQRNVRRRHFQPALKALGLNIAVRPHDFRRTFVAVQVAAGIHPKQVQARIGHSSIALTMDVYGRLAGDIPLQAEQAEKLNTQAMVAVEGLVSVGKQEAPKRAKTPTTRPERKALQARENMTYPGIA